MFYFRNLCTGDIRVYPTVTEIVKSFRRSIHSGFIKKNIGRIFYIDDTPYRAGFSLSDLLNLGKISITSRHVMYTAYHDTGSKHEFIGTFKTREALSRYIRISLEKTEVVLGSNNRRFIATGSVRSRYPRVYIEATLINCNTDYILENQQRTKSKFVDGIIHTRDIHTGACARFSCFREALTWLGIAPTQVYRAIVSEGIVNTNHGYLQCAVNNEFDEPRVQRRLAKYQYRFNPESRWSDAMSSNEIARQVDCSTNYLNALIVTLSDTRAVLSCTIKGRLIEIRLYQTDTTIPYTVVGKKKEEVYA